MGVVSKSVKKPISKHGALYRARWLFTFSNGGTVETLG